VIMGLGFVDGVFGGVFWWRMSGRTSDWMVG